MQSPSTRSAITVVQDDGVLVAVRFAHDADACLRLRHEANVLSRLDHPGIVRLVDHDDGPPARLRTAFVGPDTWQTRPPVGSEVAAGLAALAATVADLHEAGFCHGAIAAEHVLVDDGGRPVLCGMGRADTATDTSIAADLDAVATLGRRLAEHAGEDRPSLDAPLTRLEARHDDLRDTVRALDRRTAPTVRARSGPGHRTIAAALVSVVVAVLTAAVWQGRDPRPAADPPPTPAAPPSTAPTTSTSVPAPILTAPASDAIELIHEGRRYAIGRAGDIVVTGDWNCDGTPTPALLRPATGEVVVFGSWPAAASSVGPAVETSLEGALDLIVDDDPCPSLRAATTTGSRLVAEAGS